MSLVQEIIQEAKKETRSKLKRNSKRLIIVLGSIAILMSSIFYYFDFPSQDAVYRQMPVFAGVPTLAMASFNAFAIFSIPLFFLKSLSEVIMPTIKRNREEKKDAEIETNSKAVYDRFNQYGQKDYSLQIDEMKDGLKNEISEVKTDLADWKKFTSELSRRFSLKSIITDVRISQLERKINTLQQKLENKTKNTVPIEEFEKVSSRLFKVEEELRKLKGE